MIEIKRGELRSRQWFNDSGEPGSTALHIERYTNFGMTPKELRSGKPIIGIAQTGSDLVPCNRIHVELAKRVREGIREAGGIALEFPVHPIQETGKRPTAALDRVHPIQETGKRPTAAFEGKCRIHRAQRQPL